nr:restriction endonuclease subunit S [Gemmatimonadota bacterium]
MKKGSRKIARTSARPRPVTPAQGVPGYEGLVGEIGVLLDQARRTSARAVNAIMTATYWEIGRRIVEHEQQGKARAEYGEALLERLSRDLTARFGRGFSVNNLESMRTGKASLVRDDFPFERAAVNEHVFIVRVDDRIAEPTYVFYFLFSPRGKAEILRDHRGATIGGISRSFASQVRLPLPTLSEQCRIVEILDQADRLRCLRTEGDAKADRILPALFIKMFGDPVTNPTTWPKRTIGQLATVTTGSTPSRKKTECYGNHIEWVKSDNLNTPSHYITLAAEHLSEDGAKVGRTVPPGSTLVTCIAGSPSAIGNAALADREVAFNQQINAATPREGVDPYFLYAHFVIGKRLVQAASTEGMKGLVSKSRFSAIEFLAPPPELQERFGGQCKALCDQNELRLQQAAKLDRHFTVLLHRAFSGDLTVAWRTAHR